MSTVICRRPDTDLRIPDEKQEDELLAAFRRMQPKERVKLIRMARRRLRDPGCALLASVSKLRRHVANKGIGK